MTPSAIALWRWIYSQRIYVNNKVYLRTEPQGETKESHNYSYNIQAHSISITLYFWSFCLTPEPQVEPPAVLYFFTCGTRKRHVAEWRKVSVMSATSAICVIKNGVLIFREKECWKQFLRTLWGGWKCLRKCSQDFRGRVDLFFKPLIMRDSDTWKVCAQFANCANYANSHFSQKSQFAHIEMYG